MTSLKVKKEKYPERCEICHQPDCFDQIKNICMRCNKGLVNLKEQTQISTFQLMKKLKCEVIENTKEKIELSISKFTGTDFILAILYVIGVINLCQKYYFTEYKIYVLVLFIICVYHLINTLFADELLLINNSELKISSGMSKKSIVKTINIIDIKEIEYCREWFSDQLVVKLSNGKKEILFSRTDDKKKILALKDLIELKLNKLNKEI